MYKKILKEGEKFGEWTVVSISPDKIHGHISYIVKCSCGVTATHAGYYLRTGKSLLCRSCSAKKRMPKGKNCYAHKHGASTAGNPLRKTYSIWITMRQRCSDHNSRDYKNYGGRGISICREWDNFEGFYKDMGKCPDGLSLDRINNDGNYEKSNCQWATRKQQNNNRRDNTTFLIDGKKITRTQIQDKLGWTRDIYRRRFEKHGVEWILNQYSEF
jgi:hypothetical protein